MLSRAANNLYWMSRHIERAENTARLLDVTYRMSLLPYHIQESALTWAEPWALPLVITGTASAYYTRYPGALSAENVLRFMVLDATNPSSIFSSIQGARENARTERGAMPPSLPIGQNVGQVDSASVGCAMYFAGCAMMRSRKSAICCVVAAGPTSMP